MTDSISAARLDLVPLRVEHAPEMATVLSDPALHTFIGGTPVTTEVLHARYARLVAGCPDSDVSWLNWVIRLRESTRLVGTVQATITPGRRGRIAEIAWVVGIRWQGQGIASEAAQALVGWLGQLRVSTVVAHIHPDHHASTAVATAAGLTPTEHRHAGEIRWELTINPAGASGRA